MLKINVIAIIIMIALSSIFGFYYLYSNSSYVANDHINDNIHNDKGNKNDTNFSKKDNTLINNEVDQLKNIILQLREKNTNLKTINGEQKTTNLLLKEETEKLKEQIAFIKKNQNIQNVASIRSEPNSNPKISSPSFKKPLLRTSRMKGPALSKDPSFFRTLQMTSLSKEQKVDLVDLIAEYKNSEEEIMTKPRGDTVIGAEIVSELEENLSYFDQRVLNLLSPKQKEEFEFILANKK